MIEAKKNDIFEEIDEIKSVEVFESDNEAVFKSGGENLKNYRIYGNTVGGESVGDRTGNLFDNYPNTITNRGIIYTNVNNQYMTIVGESSGAYSQTNPIYYTLPQGTYFLKWYLDNEEYKSNVFMVVRDSNNVDIVNVFAKGAVFTLNNEQIIRMIIAVIQSGVNINTKIYVQLNSGSTALPYEPYGYKVPVTVSNDTDTLTTTIYLPEQIRKVGDEAEYIDYAEQKMHRIGADDIDVTLPELLTVAETNLLNVNTNIKPSKVWGRISDPIDILYVKDNLGNILFSKYHEVEEEPPLTYKAKKTGTLENYRIYGNTVDGESVGDRTGNLFDEFSVHGMVPSVSTGELTNSPSGGATTDFIPIINGDITLSKSNAAQSNMYIFLYAQDKSYVGYTQTMAADTLILYGNSINGYQNAKYARIRVDIESAYTQTNTMLNAGSTALPYEPYGYKVPVTVEGKNLFDETQQMAMGVIDSYGNINPSITYAEYTDYIPIHTDISYSFSCEYNTTKNVRIAFYNSSKQFVDRMVSGGTNPTVTFNRSVLSDVAFIRICLDIGWQKCMLNEGSTALPYEPYHAPVITPIYLPEQIKMVGEEAEYIDYAEQKQHRVRKNLFDGEFLQGYWALADGAFTTSDKWICTQKTPCKANTDYTFTFGIKSRWYGIAWYDIDGNYIEFSDSSIYSQPTIFTTTSPANAVFMGIDIAGLRDSTGQVYYDIHPSDVTDFMLVEGSTPLPYEPYIENTDLDVTLPALPTLTGTNVLSVGTAVQPSEVYIKGKIKEIN